MRVASLHIFLLLFLSAVRLTGQYYPQTLEISTKKHNDELVVRSFTGQSAQTVEWSVQQTAVWEQYSIHLQKTNSSGKEDVQVPASRVYAMMPGDSGSVVMLNAFQDTLVVQVITADLHLLSYRVAETADPSLGEVIGWSSEQNNASFYLRRRDSVLVIAKQGNNWTLMRSFQFQRSQSVVRAWRQGEHDIIIKQLGSAMQGKSQSCIVEVLTSDNTLLASHLLPAYPDNITAEGKNLYYIYTEAKGYTVAMLPEYYSPFSKPQQCCSIESDNGSFYEPLLLSIHNDILTAVFRNGIVRMKGKEVLSASTIELSEFERGNVFTLEQSERLYLWNPTTMFVFSLTEDNIWFLRSALNDVIRYGGLTMIILAFIFISLRGLRYRRQLRDVVEADSGTIAFVVDRNMKLRRINARGRELFEMDTTTPLRRVLKYYCNGEMQRIVESFVGSAFSSRVQQSQKLTLRSSAIEKEIIFTAQPLRSLSGGFDGLVVHGVDITTELERKRLVNWAQLAHDMQTNLSIIKLNTEQLATAVKPEYEDRRKRILFQTGLLLQRVRDIVSIGRDEQLHLSELDIRDIFREVANEFDDASFAHAQIHIQEQAFIVKIDKAKMLRALRNAVENSIRALRGEQGSIRLTATRQGQHLIIAVSDTGIGMDEATKENFLKPYFSNYRQYGGTGIGTMIMLRAVEIHSGSIEVESEAGKGTTIAFKLPGNLYVRS